jgi:hypothetical protein
MAQSAASFGSYYTTGNRGSDVPGWAPSAEVADAIDYATSVALREDGSYEVSRRPGGPARNENPMPSLWSRFS